MMPPLTIVLLKIFARGFYREHFGLLLFSFVTVVCYCFFIYTTHMSPGQASIAYNLALVLAIISTPVMLGLVFVVWGMYTIKSWKYVTAQLAGVQQQFIFYSVTSFSRRRQFMSWFIVQLAVSFPFVVFGLFAFVVGVFFHYYLIPAAILCYIVLLAGISAAVYVYQVNHLISVSAQPYLLRKLSAWRKPFFSLFFYHVLDKLKLTYVVTKVLSWGIIGVVFEWYNQEHHNGQIIDMLIAGIVLAHALLLYQVFQFEQTTLSFSRNFPYSRIRLFSALVLRCFILILPETVWLFISFEPAMAAEFTLLALATMILFQSLLYRIGQDMMRYLQWIFGLSMLIFIASMFHLIWMVIVVSLPVSFRVFYRNYYSR